MASAAATTRPLPRLLRKDLHRFYVAFSVSAVPAAVVSLLTARTQESPGFAFLVCWYGVHLLLHAALTVFAYQRDFVTTRSERPTPHGWWQRLTQLGSPADNAVSFAGFAMGAAVFLAATGVSDRSAVLSVGTVVLVIGAWSYLLVGFAADYAQRERREGGLAFPGEPAASFSDFVYFSAAVTTTFGPTDVTVTTGAMRRHVLLHGIVAFVFNTVILGLVISTLLS
jgi:hypothetical protein